MFTFSESINDCYPEQTVREFTSYHTTHFMNFYFCVWKYTELKTKRDALCLSSQQQFCLDVRREKNISALTQTWTLDIRCYRKLACFHLQLLFPERSAEVVAVCDGAARRSAVCSRFICSVCRLVMN